MSWFQSLCLKWLLSTAWRNIHGILDICGSLFLSSEALKKNGGSSYESASLTYSNIILMSAPPLPKVLVWENYLPCGVPPTYPAPEAVANIATSPTPILLFSSLSSTLRSPTFSLLLQGFLWRSQWQGPLLPPGASQPTGCLGKRMMSLCGHTLGIAVCNTMKLVNNDIANYKWTWLPVQDDMCC